MSCQLVRLQYGTRAEVAGVGLAISGLALVSIPISHWGGQHTEFSLKRFGCQTTKLVTENKHTAVFIELLL